MSLAPTLSHGPPALASTTVRQFCRVLVFTALALGAGCLFYVVETFIVHPPRRFIENPSDVIMRALGMAHFFIGLLFLVTSPRIRHRRAVLSLLALAALGGALCLAFGVFGGWHNPLALAFFYGYFLIHEVNDEMQLYQCYEQGGTATPEQQRCRNHLSAGVAVIMMALLAAAFVLHPHGGKKTAALQELPVFVSAFVVVACLTGGCLLLVRAWRQGITLWHDGPSFLDVHRPVLIVYAILMALVLMIPLFGSGAFNLIVLIHVGSWWVFVRYQLGRQRGKQPANTWQWLRCTSRGFLTLHLAVAALFLALMVARVYWWDRHGLLSDLVAGPSFPYWSVMHITMSLVRLR